MAAQHPLGHERMKQFSHHPRQVVEELSGERVLTDSLAFLAREGLADLPKRRHVGDIQLEVLGLKHQRLLGTDTLEDLLLKAQPVGSPRTGASKSSAPRIPQRFRR